MRQPRSVYLIFMVAVLLLLGMTLLPGLVTGTGVLAQGGPAAETPTEQPPPPTVTTPAPGETETPVPATETPVPPTEEPPAETATPTATSSGPGSSPGPSQPVTIPEPITVVLFGTGLAALSAAAASRRKKDE
ncbi:PEP-CTERM sorting domain-containing protein [Litorilinea aerophila]|uniref:PEP-CTERM sorting domain-containing protein n=1 Tax=Litorilinea aerophila TaxID=1204385 RepID=A0A540VLK9_9CHLR|nr:PEP-CTERM sorting domain-containing protein [Litorilinea aerophila]